MPTPNDFSAVRYPSTGASSQGDSTGTWYQQGEGPNLPGPTSGDYPRTFDSNGGEHYAPTPGNYPVDITSDRNVVNGVNTDMTGSYGQVTNVSNDYYPGTNMVPSPTPSKQFSLDKESDPVKLMESTRPSIENHANLNESYGLLQPASTVGHTPWLRDSLANPGELEPGNAAPHQMIKVPLTKNA